MPLFWHRRDPLNAIYLMHSITDFAMALIGIFIPIYLLTLGYSVETVIFFFMVYYGAGVVSAFAAVYIAARIGLENTIMIRFPFLFAFLGLLFLVDSPWVPVFGVAVLGGFQNLLYWIPLHILFARRADNEKVGEATGKLFGWPKLLSMGAPLAGGFIAAIYGFKVLLLIVFAVLIAAIIPILNYRPGRESSTAAGRILAWLRLRRRSYPRGGFFESGRPEKASFRFEFRRGMELYRRYPKIFWAEVADNVGEEIGAIIWPLFVYLSLFSFTAVGFVGTLIGISTAAFTFAAGKLSDRFRGKTMIKAGALALLAVWAFRYYADTGVLIYSSTVLYGFAAILFIVPFSALVYRIGQRDPKILDEFFVFREIPVFLGRALALGLALLLVNNFNLAFPIAGLAYLYFLFL